MPKTYRDVKKRKACVAIGCSVIHDEDDLAVEFVTVYVEAHYWAEPTDPEDGVNRPDYDDEINIFINNQDAEKFISPHSITVLELQCQELFRIELMQSVGRTLSFSR